MDEEEDANRMCKSEHLVTLSERGTVCGEGR
jgi:rRNA maturation protein Nop10